jgi:thiosulfate dehydrogenase
VVYAQKCAQCHQADGAGIKGAFPPLWGATSFNGGAGMAHIDRMTGFVRYNMPRDAPGSLTLDDAYDVSAYVLAHKRPHFNRRVLVLQMPLNAGYF